MSIGERFKKINETQQRRPIASTRMTSLMTFKSAMHATLSAFDRGSQATSTVLESALASLYARTNRRPWRLGYVQFRAGYLKQALADPALMAGFARADPLPAGYGYRMDARVVEIPWTLARLDKSKVDRILDAGSSLNSLAALGAPALRNKKITIATLAPERRCYWQRGVSYVYEDLRALPFRDDCFDAVACISTIEHVGMNNVRYAGNTSAAQRQEAATEFLQAVRELRRVLRPGASLLITFPFGRYEDHGWFQQFDATLADRLSEEFAPAHTKETVFRYHSDGWRHSKRADCADCEFFDVQESKYFKKDSALDFPPHYPAGESAVMCMELTK